MNVGKLAARSIRVLIFGGFVMAMIQAVSVVLESPAQRTTIVILLTVGSIALILGVCAWLLRKLWVWSGRLAAQIVPKELMASTPALARESKREEQA